MTIEVLQHVPHEGPGAIEAWARERGIALRIVRLDRGEVPTAPRATDGLVVMGGPMSVHEEEAHPWLRAEKQLIADTIAHGGRVLGICLGAQLIASALGARVYANREKEIGWWPVEWTPAAQASRLFEGMPASHSVFHWHGDTFELPPGAIHLAQSAACAHQAFVLSRERVIGLQFHLEATREGVDDLLREAAADLTAGPYVQSAQAIREGVEQCASLRHLLFEVLDRWLPSNV
jgi:GMP synthase-like glutamine amidotransferase